MSENNLIAFAAFSDDNAVNRLFEIMASGGENSQEFMVLDAIVYQRLASTYDQATPVPSQLQAVEAA